jgi:hypothetical protein
MIYQQKKPTPILNYTIFGERHSGTNLVKNLHNHYFDIKLTWEFGWKHWIGFTPKKTIVDSENTLFVCVVRNPYDWLMALYKNPYHMPVKNYKCINNFFYNEWYSIYDFLEGEIYEDRNYITNLRYKNIFELRKYKINYLRQTVPFLANNYILIRYEDLLKNHYSIIKTISSVFDLKIKSHTQYNVYSKKAYHLSQDILGKINFNIDWSTEKTIGYIPKYKT